MAIINGTNNADILNGTTGDDNINGQGGDDTIYSNGGRDIIMGGDGNDRIYAGTGEQYLYGDNGDDVYYDVNTSLAVIQEDWNGGIDTVYSGSSTINWSLDYSPLNYPDGSTSGIVWQKLNTGSQLILYVENLTLTGSGNVNIYGNLLNNILKGNNNDNKLWGAAGDDTLDGGGGNDIFRGGVGNDLYVVDSISDVLIENINEGTDTVQSSVTYTLGTNLENLTLTGASTINGTGNTLNNILIGNSGNNILDGGLGNDTLTGGLGNDTYVIDAIGDVVTENASEGTDSVQSSVNYTLVANFENLTLTGASTINSTGNTLNNTLVGNGGNNILDGGIGNDTLIGGLGNDTYVIDAAGDVVTENTNEGTDSVQSSMTYTLGANLEKLILTGVAAINGTGNISNNSITGNSGNNILDGGIGNDTLAGGSGNDFYIVDNVNDVIKEYQEDIICISNAYDANQSYGYNYCGGAKFSSDGSKVVFFSDANNLVQGDTNGKRDIFVKDLNTKLTIRINTAANGDQANGDSDGATFSTDGTKIIFQSNANNLVSGDTNNVSDIFIKDLLTGIVSRISTTTDGNQGNGDSSMPTFSNDGTKVTFQSKSSNLVLGDTNAKEDIFVKDLVTGVVVRINITNDGDQANNNSNNASLSSDGTKLVFQSLAGNLVAGDTNAHQDIFIKDLSTGVITRINTNLNGDQTFVDVGGASLSSDGNQILFYSYADNLVSGDSNTYQDIFIKDIKTGVITRVNTTESGVQANSNSGSAKFSSDGKKVVFFSFANNLVPADTSLSGGLFIKDLITGVITCVSTAADGSRASADVGDASFSADGTKLTFMGRAPNLVSSGTNGDWNIFVKNLPADAGGVDSVQASVSYVISNFVENLTLTGSANINGTGNSLNNTLVGNSGNNLLNGGAGNDTLIGGAGNDTYVVDSDSDVATENANEGTDSVQSSVTYTLGANLENLTLTGITAINGTGNTLNNSLTGNSGNNILTGGVGNDTLTGGAGSDTYRYSKGDGLDLIINTDSSVGRSDILQVSGLGFQDFTFSRTVNTLVVNAGATDSISVQDFYANAANQLDRIEYSNGVGVVDHVTGSIDFTSTDTANLLSWSSWHQVRNAQLQIVQDDIVMDNGSKSNLEYDVSNTKAWQSYRTGVDSAARTDWVQVLNDDGSFDQTDFDQASTESWTVRNDHKDNTGALDWLRVQNDNGSEDWLDLDQTNVQVWKEQNRHLDNQDRLDYIQTINDDTTVDWQDEDQDSSQTWATVNSHQLADNRLDWRRYINDNGTEDWLDLDQDNTQTWKEQATHKDSLGRDDTRTVIWDNNTKDIIDLDQSNVEMWQQYTQHFNAPPQHFVAPGAYLGSDVLLDAGIDGNEVWLRQVGNSLEVSQIGTTQKMTIVDWFVSAPSNQKTNFQLASGGTLLATEVQALVTAMASFAPPAVGQTSLTTAQHQALDGVIAANWS